MLYNVGDWLQKNPQQKKCGDHRFVTGQSALSTRLERAFSYAMHSGTATPFDDRELLLAR